LHGVLSGKKIRFGVNFLGFFGGKSEKFVELPEMARKYSSLPDTCAEKFPLFSLPTEIGL
jgi:hypothetical protein